MKHFPPLTILVAIAMLLSACGAQAAPTANPVDIQNTAVAAAMTIVAQTQAAVPTATLPPPTEPPTQTSLPSITPLASPTALQAAGISSPTIAPAANSGADPCETAVLAHSPLGKNTTIRIWNNTKVPVTVSLYLNKTEAHGECGFRGYQLSKNGDVIITDLVYGCYYVVAYSDDPKGRFWSSGSGCINNPDKWTFIITSATVNLAGP